MDGFLPRIFRVSFPLLFVLGLLAGCDNEAPDDETQPARAPEIPRIVTAQEALAGAHIPTLDPATMNSAEIRKAIGNGPRCIFRYTSTGRPVLAVSTGAPAAAAEGVVKLNGHLVPLKAAPIEPAGRNGEILLLAEPIRMTVAPDPGAQTEDPGYLRRQANMIFEVGQSLRVGYRGYLECGSETPVKSPGS
ncbi:MAG: DUF6692 family protein [Alphaproteobacteria bacterium]